MAKPTLALIPAAQGSKFYSVLPSNGVGDFDFTRSGSATRINSQGLIETVASGVSRLNYPLIDGVVNGCPSHLLEPTKQNVLQRSEEFDNAYWINNGVTINANQTISPSGDLSADLLTGVSGGFGVVRFSTWSATNKVASCFAKKGSTNLFKIANGSGGAGGVTFNLENGTVTNEDSGFEGSIENYGNGWYRCTAIDTLGRSGTFSLGVTAASESIYIWGAQLESGYKTSYIPTTTAAVTRSAETVASAGDASTFNSQSGALFGEFKTDPDGGNFLISISEDNNNSGAVFIGANASEKIYTYYNSANYVSDINSYDSFNKVCISWGSDGVKVYINGLSKTVLGSQALSTSNYNNIKFSRANTSLKFLGQIKDLRVYKTALTDQELQTLTTI
jgi:hypothetical protein